MVKSFINAFCGGVGRTLGKILVYLAIGLIFFFIYDEANAAAIYGQNSCSSTYYNIVKQNGDVTYGQTSTSYNIPWDVIYFSGTENMTANTYYDLKITFRSNLSLSSFSDGDPEIYKTSSLCGTWTQKFQVSGYGISGSVLTIRFLTGTSMVDFWDVKLFYNYTGSQGINTVTLSKVDLSGSGGIIENANDNTNTIINNQNENTQDVIDNQNQNTQDVIDNQNQNTQDIIDAQNHNANDIIESSKCLTNYSYNPTTFNFTTGYLNSSGAIVNDNSYMTSPFMQILPNREYKITWGPARTGKYVCLYNGNKNMRECFEMSGTSITFTSPNLDNILLRVVSIKSGTEFVPVTISGPICNNWTLEQQNEINSFLSDTSDGDTNIFSTWWDNFDPLSNPLGNVITLPVTLAQKIVGFNSSSCQSINLGNLLGHNLTLTCFTLTSVLPDNASSLINTIDIIMSVSLLVVIIKNTYETIANLISLGGENKIKSHFRLPTPLEFLSSVLNGNGYAEYIEYR